MLYVLLGATSGPDRIHISFLSQQTRSEACQWWNYSNWCPTNDIIQNRNCTPHKYSVDTREGVINPGRVFWNSEILIQWVDKWSTDHHHLQSPLNPKLEDSIIWHQLQTCPLSQPSLISIQSSELNFNITEKCHPTELQVYNSTQFYRSLMKQMAIRTHSILINRS